MSEPATTTGLLGDLPAHVVAAVVERGSSPQAPDPGHRNRHRGVRRTKHLDGRRAAAEALAGLGVAERAVGVGASGEPLFPAGVVGSISHARELSVAVVAARSTTGGIGVDVEDDRAVDGIESHVLTPAEVGWLTSPDPDEHRRRLLSVFSAKEAVYKAFFPRVGRFFGFQSLRLEPAPGGYVAEFVAAVDPAYPPGRRFHVASRWVGDVVASHAILERP